MDDILKTPYIKPCHAHGTEHHRQQAIADEAKKLFTRPAPRGEAGNLAYPVHPGREYLVVSREYGYCVCYGEDGLLIHSNMAVPLEWADVVKVLPLPADLT